jgi:hypothetical protein
VEYLIGAIAGLIYGGIVAFLKGRFLWKRSLESDTPEHLGGVMAASALSFGINVLALAIIIKRSVEQKKNPYKNEIFSDTKDFQLALARAEES